MTYAALATDYDGTAARDGVLSPSTVDALLRFKNCSRKLLLVTGREILDLKRFCDRLEIFDLVVAENGAVLYWPGADTSRPLFPAPQRAFVEMLRARGVSPLSVGDVVVASLEHNRKVVDECIDELKLDLHVIMNKGSMMILPQGVDKVSGLKAALPILGLEPAKVAAIGDAENDFGFLRACGYSAAVANALPFLKTQVDWVAPSSHGKGVEEFVEHLMGITSLHSSPR